MSTKAIPRVRLGERDMAWTEGKRAYVPGEKWQANCPALFRTSPTLRYYFRLGWLHAKEARR